MEICLLVAVSHPLRPFVNLLKVIFALLKAADVCCCMVDLTCFPTIPRHSQVYLTLRLSYNNLLGEGGILSPVMIPSQIRSHYTNRASALDFKDAATPRFDPHNFL